MSRLKYARCLYTGMNETEEMAQEILTVLGWEPRRIVINTRTGENVGMPDFKCNNNRYVEVKVANDGLLRTQIDKFYDMIQEEKEIYIIVFSGDHAAVSMFRYLYRYIPLISRDQPPAP